MNKRGSSGRGHDNPYARSYRSDSLHALEAQVAEIQQRMVLKERGTPGMQEFSVLLNEVRADIKQLRELMMSEAERTQLALNEIRHWMNTKLPANDEGHHMVECLDRVREIVRLQMETSTTMSELLAKQAKRPRVDGGGGEMK